MYKVLGILIIENNAFSTKILYDRNQNTFPSQKEPAEKNNFVALMSNEYRIIDKVTPSKYLELKKGGYL